MSDDAAEFAAPWFDVDEWREDPIPHRHLHGGFEGTNTLFTIRLPEADRYRGRMLQVLGGGQGGSERVGEMGGAFGLSAASRMTFVAAEGTWFPAAAERGAFYVESNQGFRAGIDEVPEDLSLVAYRATAHTAEFAVELAEEHYGRPVEHRYLTGWSGGGNRSINVMEHTNGLFDGAVGGGVTSLPIAERAWSTVAWAESALRDILPNVVANSAAGGSGDPFAATRTSEQREALLGLYRVGFPRGSEAALESGASWMPGWHYLPFVDPGYLDDFFGNPGYAGHDGLVDRIQGSATIAELVEAEPGSAEETGVRLDLARRPADLVGTYLTIEDGPRAGSGVLLTTETDGVLYPAGPVQPGDRVSLDNGRWLALKHYHRDIDRRAPGRFAASLEYTGNLHGKFLFVQAAHDHMALTEAAVLYDRSVSTRDRYRLWWIENADHGSPAPGSASARYVDWMPPFFQAIDDLIAWVEDGVEPAPDSAYEVDAHGIMVLPPSAIDRRGIQPTATLLANGERRIHAAAGETIEFRVTADAPPGSLVVEIAWDPEGTGEWRDDPGLAPSGSVVATLPWSYASPGRYTPGVRVRSRRDDTSALIDNVGHAFIDVAEGPGAVAG